MKELFREQDITRVRFFESMLKSHEIPTMIRNEHLTVSGLTEIPIPEFFPALCVYYDQDYERAVEIIREYLDAEEVDTDEEVTCPSCGESNPGNFGACWSCNQPIHDQGETS